MQFESKGRRFAEGDHQHTIHVGGGGSVTLYLPIVPFKLGEVTVQVTAVIPGKKLRAKVTLLVEVSYPNFLTLSIMLPPINFIW